MTRKYWPTEFCEAVSDPETRATSIQRWYQTPFITVMMCHFSKILTLLNNSNDLTKDIAWSLDTSNRTIRSLEWTKGTAALVLSTAPRVTTQQDTCFIKSIVNTNLVFSQCMAQWFALDYQIPTAKYIRPFQTVFCWRFENAEPNASETLPLIIKTADVFNQFHKPCRWLSIMACTIADDDQESLSSVGSRDGTGFATYQVFVN